MTRGRRRATLAIERYFHAGGVADFMGDVRGHSVRAEDIRIAGGKVRARVLHGRSSIEIGAADIQSDMLMATTVMRPVASPASTTLASHEA